MKCIIRLFRKYRIQTWIMSYAVIQWIPYLDNPLVLESGCYTKIQIEPDIEIKPWDSNLDRNHKLTNKSIDNYVDWYKKWYHEQNKTFILLSLTRIK